MSHRVRVPESTAMLPSTTYSQVSQTVKTSRPAVDKTSQRLSMTSNSSTGRRSSTSLEGISSSRPSGIPRPTKAPPTTRPNTIAPQRTNANLQIRSKATTNVSGVGARTIVRNRATERLAPTDRTPRIVTDDDLMSLEPAIPSLDMDHDSVFGIAIPQKLPPATANLPPRLIPELQALAATTYRKPTPAMSIISTVSSPSTQLTTSPSPWSASTTATTPTSWSSASPSLVQPARSQTLNKRSQTVPIPSGIRAKMLKLPVLQESATSSASSSKANIQKEEVSTPKKIKKRTPVNSPAPTPPPRTSSIKRNRSRSNSKVDESPAPPQGVPPLPREEEISPISRHVEETASRSKPAFGKQHLTDHHNKLQDAINFMPLYPTEDGTDNTQTRQPQPFNSNRIPYDEQTRKLLEPAPIEALPQPFFKASLQLSRIPDLSSSTPSQPPKSRLAKFSKLALFGKSPKKTDVDTDISQQPRKLQRKGPTAGTGHEAYNKFRHKEKRTSTDGHATATDSEASVTSTRNRPVRSMSRKDSSNSVKRNRASQSDLDDFAASRLKPVVILGGSQKVDGGLSSHPCVEEEMKSTGAVTIQDASIQDQLRHVSVTSSGPLMRESRLFFHLDSLDSQEKPALAIRRSQKFNNPSNFRIPPSINTKAFKNPPYPSSHNTSQSSIGGASAALTETSSDLFRVDTKLLEKQKKKSRKLNWGFFKKKEFVPEAYQPRTSSRPAIPRMAVRISDVQPSRPMPYYAMLESENEISHAEAMGEFLAEAASSIPTFEEKGEDDEVISPTGDFKPEPPRSERTKSILLPSIPHIKNTDSPLHYANVSHQSSQTRSATLLPEKSATKVRKPRLAQVGRIPKVVPTTQPSFSRPFPPATPVDNQGSNVTTTESGIPSLPAKNTVIEFDQNHVDLDRGKMATRLPPVCRDKVPTTAGSVRDALRILDRYSTTSSSSDGVISVMGPPLLPAPELPRRSVRYTTSEDDVWNEYDDFIDRVILSPRLKKSRARITDEDKVRPISAFKYDASTERALPSRKMPRDLAVDTSLAPPPLLFASPLEIGGHDLEEDVRLRRSRIVSALHSSMDPSSPFSIADYLAELGEYRRNSGRTSGRLSDSTISQGGLRSPQLLSAFPEPLASHREYKHYENTVHMDDFDRSKDPTGHSERSYASLMVSRWLSFGRVLFSPAHTDIQKQQERHVLVIDGLGNEDWSLYCAVTYQTEQAYVYDLKEIGQPRSSISPTKTNQAPQNFRRRELASFNEVFKFPDNFFSVIVLRFPPVMAESKLKNIISECRRVLAPGGYMELMLLDLDIVNMGVLTRRAMRDLKIKIAMRNREVNLKPVIDNVQSVLGEKGFSKLSRCVVGVPVVGKPPGAETPTSSRSSGASDNVRRSPSAGPRPLAGLEGQYHHNFSLNDLVADHSDNADAKIGRVVSRTARSWWQHCFEAAVIPDGDLSKSIFANKQVLSECKARASSFKLLIAYTQKPTNPSFGMKRRTMSEPVIATLATARA